MATKKTAKAKEQKIALSATVIEKLSVITKAKAELQREFDHVVDKEKLVIDTVISTSGIALEDVEALGIEENELVIKLK